MDYNNKLMECLYFLVCGNTELDDLFERVDKLMKEIIDEADWNWSRRNYVINLYNNNASLELISKSTGLSIKEIKKIIENKK